MMTRLSLILPLALALTACDRTIHQYPEPQDADVILCPYFHLEPYRSYKEVVYDERWHASVNTLPADTIADPSLPGGTELAVTLDVCRGTTADDELAEWRTDVARRLQLTAPGSYRDYSGEALVALPDGQYHVLAWADLAPGLYNKESLTAIDTDLRQLPAFCHLQNAMSGSEQFAVDFQLGPGGFPTIEGQRVKSRRVPVELHRTQGRFRIVATDLKDYLLENPTAEGIRVRAQFTLYVSTGFNAATDLPNRFVSEYTIDARPAEGTDDEMDMMTHYVFTRPEGETVVKADFYLYDRNGRLFNTVRDIDIPVLRGRETIIRGHFLTHHVDTGSSLGVDENYDGEYLVPVD